jgi:branched-subunit amino acid aminotransferase/4-amino-4-deoxychorismate lyase
MDSKPHSNLTTMKASVTFHWCCIASIGGGGSAPHDQHQVQVSKLAGYDSKTNIDDTAIRLVQDHRMDLTESAGWMEYLERTENRIQDAGGAGAYDTFRCDLLLGNTDNRWNRWGQDFHLERLKKSFLALTEEEGEDNWNMAVKKAEQQSQLIIDRLLNEAAQSELLQRRSCNTESNDLQIQIVRLTLLWSPIHITSAKKFDILVRGHACCSARSVVLHRNVKPIVASIAAQAHEHGKYTSVDSNLPTRTDHPNIKIASWTRLRKEMEKPNTYKPPGVSEVLMVRQNGSELELLEGLSSNLFVIYKDGTIRTAHVGVLFGYVRHLVLDCASACGLIVDNKPILLSDATKGLWEEVFITSSSRLIYPVERILIPTTDDENKFEEVWKDATLTTDDSFKLSRTAKWRELLDEIMYRNGYPRSNA